MTDQTTRRPASPVLVTADAVLADRVRELAAAAGAAMAVVATAAAAGRLWVESPLVLVGPDVPADALPGRRDRLVLVARTADPALWQQAGVMGAAHVLVLPGGESVLADLLLTAPSRGAPSGRVVGVVGAVGGCGASTLAVAIAATQTARSALLVDADRVGAGLDLALGTEHEPGLRWGDLAGVRGALRPELLTQALPVLDGVHLLGWGAGEGSETVTETGDHGVDYDGLVPLDALRSVTAAARSTVDLTVLDLPRRLDPAAAQHWRLLDAAVLVVPAQVRAVVAGRGLLDHLTAVVPEVHVVVRSGTRGGLGVTPVGDALAWAISGRWASDPRLADAAERGDLLHASRSGPTGRLARDLVQLLGEHSDRIAAGVL